MVATVVTSLTNNFTEEQIESLLNTSMSGGLGKGGKILSTHKIKLGTFFGKEVEAETAGKFFAKMRFYQVGHNLQEVVTLTSLTNQHSTNASRFLDSFSVISPSP